MVKNTENITNAQFWIDGRIRQYVGKTVQELKEIFLPNAGENKAKFVNLAKAMLKVSNNKLTLPGDINAVLKTVRVMGNGSPAESMSFMNVDFQEWCKNDLWQKSALYQYFESTALLFFVVQQYTGGKRVPDDEMLFKGVKLEYISSYDLNHGIKDVWDRVRILVLRNELEINPFTQKNGKIVMRNNLPSGKFNGIAHLRPGGVNALDVVELPNGQHIARQRFWLNSEYVAELIKEVL